MHLCISLLLHSVATAAIYTLVENVTTIQGEAPIEACTNETLRLHNKPEAQLLKFNEYELHYTQFRDIDLNKSCPRFSLEDESLGEGSVTSWKVHWAGPRPELQATAWLHTRSVGRTHLRLALQRCEDNRTTAMMTVCRQRLVVSSPHRFMDKVFNIVVFVLVIFVSLLMGALLDTSLIVKQFRRPLPLLVGSCSQCLVMPLTAFTITWLFGYPSVQGIGLFVVGCSPGGTNSNQWTVLFDGDIDLSAVMTFLSTVGSLFIMPAWLFSLGRYYVGQLEIQVPYWLLARNLLMVIGPYAIGIGLTHCVPRLKAYVLKLVKPLVAVMLIFFSGVGTYVNLHLFRMLKWRHALTAPLLPWLGFALGFILSALCGLPARQRRTVSIETGFQNAGIAMLIIQNNFPPPENEMASVIVLVTAILSSVPMLVAYMCLRVIDKVRQMKERKALRRRQKTDEMQRLVTSRKRSDEMELLTAANRK